MGRYLIPIRGLNSSSLRRSWEILSEVCRTRTLLCGVSGCTNFATTTRRQIQEENLSCAYLAGFTRISIGSLESTIEKELASLANQLSTKYETIAAEIGRIRKSGITTLQYTDPELDGSDQEATREPVIVRHSPDASFKHPIAGSQAPGLVVEVSYSQRSKKLSRSAGSYIINSEHRIRCVVAVDITYIPAEHKGSRKDKTATVSVWRTSLEEHDGELVGICRQDVDAAPFRDCTGRPCEGDLQLTLADFLHPVVREKVLPATMRDGKETLSVPFETLAKLLNEAESDQGLLAESD